MYVREKRVMQIVMLSHDFVYQSHCFVMQHDTKYDTKMDAGKTPASAFSRIVSINHGFDLCRLFDSLFMFVIVDCQHISRRFAVFLSV